MSQRIPTKLLRAVASGKLCFMGNRTKSGGLRGVEF